MSRGRVVALEALDGVGKSTTAGLLPDFRSLSTPGDALADARRAMHRFAADDQLALQVFYASSVCAVGRHARRIAATGRDVVIDRYWLSTIAYGLARGSRAPMHDLALAVPPVDVTVLLTLDEGVRRARLASRGMTMADRETLRRAFRDDVMTHIRARAADRPVGRFVEVATDGLSPAGVAAAILRRL